MARFFNTAFSLSMVSAPATLDVAELSVEEAASFLRDSDFNNVANPNHANTLEALTRKLGVDVASEAKGGRVSVTSGDQMLVGQVTFPPDVPRETTHYTDEQLALGRFSFLCVSVR